MRRSCKKLASRDSQWKSDSDFFPKIGKENQSTLKIKREGKQKQTKRNPKKNERMKSRKEKTDHLPHECGFLFPSTHSFFIPVIPLHFNSNEKKKAKCETISLLLGQIDRIFFRLFYEKLGGMHVLTSQWGFTRPSSIYVILGIVRDIVPLLGSGPEGDEVL